MKIVFLRISCIPLIIIEPYELLLTAIKGCVSVAFISTLTETVGTDVKYERKNLVGHKKASSPMANHLRMKELDNP